VDAVEPQIRALLAVYPRMPATVIAERIGWGYSASILRSRVSQVRLEYRRVDSADRLRFESGELAQLDLWFPDYLIPLGFAQQAKLPVLTMTLGFSRVLYAVRTAGAVLEPVAAARSAAPRSPADGHQA
jgi:hypothetical protein